ncbi:MAG: hypothetical protein NW218_12960 [Saprospiraceae bacterium]|nr:hypothetical protein [Saprospiraceae bacterium]
MTENSQLTFYMPMFMAFLTAVIAMVSAYITTKFQFWNEKAKKENEKRQEFKEVRYKAVILLMLSALNFDKSKPMLHLYGRTSINTIEDLVDELDVEWKNMILYANDKVVKAMGAFLQVPSMENFWSTSIEMRKDLYGIKTHLEKSDFQKYIDKAKS